MSIQRWDMHHVQGEVYIDRNDEGSWVRYEDHVAAAQKAYREGYSDHARTVQHWQDTHGAYRQHGEGTNP